MREGERESMALARERVRESEGSEESERARERGE